jgi:hypothetical protein
VTDFRPTLEEQIDAVEWATQQAIGLSHKWTKQGKLNLNQIYTLVRRLEAAVETLMILEFGRARPK